MVPMRAIAVIRLGDRPFLSIIAAPCRPDRETILPGRQIAIQTCPVARQPGRPRCRSTRQLGDRRENCSCHAPFLPYYSSVRCSPSVRSPPHKTRIPNPLRIQLGGADPLATPSRIRAYLRDHGLPPMGRGHLQIPAAFRQTVVPDQYVVRFRTATAKRSFAANNAAIRPSVVSEITKLNIQTIRLRRPEDVEAYRRDPNVLWIKSNAMRYPLVSRSERPGLQQPRHRAGG